MRTLNLEGEDALRAAPAWWLFAIIGIASLAAGVILVVKPSHSLATLAVIVGIFLLLDGIIELVRSFGHDIENRALAAIVGLLGIVVGIILIRHPFHGVTAIGLLVGIWLVAAGVIRLFRALQTRAHLLIQSFTALVEVAAGIVIVSDPHIGYSTLAVLAGICLILNGLGMIALGVAVRGAASELRASPQAS